ncbi:MAG TPA: Na(+)/H(+) antiporter subunit C [Anaerolineae bacterium]|nr:Na(+)/H(+) antiporter subunit C [Anaerolineae bacterium]
MELIMAVVIGVLFATGVYLILRRSIVKLLLGLLLLSHSANLLLFTVGGLRRAAPPIIGEGAAGGLTDPLPQALILTAIVIGFGLIAFTLVLVYRVDQAVGSDDLADMRSTDQSASDGSQ